MLGWKQAVKKNRRHEKSKITREGGRAKNTQPPVHSCVQVVPSKQRLRSSRLVKDYNERKEGDKKLPNRAEHVFPTMLGKLQKPPRTPVPFDPRCTPTCPVQAFCK
uniref:Uncharacterized protein n=1 Tax=Photinus pyralis TaxID=7054 RepID=A0A1Y1MS09_PHOPY